MLCFASTELQLKIIPAGMVVVVCVCVFGGGGGFLFRDRKMLMYCFYCFIKNNTLKTALPLKGVGWGLGHNYFFFGIMMPLKNNQLPNLMISVCKTCSTLFLHCKLLSVFHKHHCIGITFTYRKSSVSPNGGRRGGLFNLDLKEGSLTEIGGGGDLFQLIQNLIF